MARALRCGAFVGRDLGRSDALSWHELSCGELDRVGQDEWTGKSVSAARWGLVAAEAVLRLRALKTSGDVDEYWRFHERQEFLRNHASRYTDGKVVPIRDTKRRSLKRVK